MKRNDFFSDAKAVGSISYEGKDYKWYACPCPASFGGLNGYIEFEKRPVKEPGYEGILGYVPVHGGITFALEMEDGAMVYGFDTAHYDSPNHPINDENWIRGQCYVMLRSILALAAVEDEYLKDEDSERRIRLIESVFDKLEADEEFDGQPPSTMAMLRIISGHI